MIVNFRSTSGALLFLFLCCTPCLGQLAQAVRGQLLNEASGQPVEGALIAVENGNQRYNAVSDAEGRFEFAAVQPGHYRFRVRHLSYAPYDEAELLVESSKSTYRRILLKETVQALQEVEIASAPLPPNLNKREFTVAQTQRYPATFFDPARLVLSQPGVTQANDQANHVVVHGLSPVGIQWRLEELPILNPNHLGNAGTRRDRGSASGGGVNMLSGQLLANSSFITGGIPPRYGNAVTGVFDMRLRPGNMQEREHTLQASLLGIDLATEGPIAKESSSYLVNYRYSTVGLLSQMGVDFGGEKIQFQDLSANLVFDSTPLGRLGLFMLGGLSSNHREPLEDQDLWEQDKDRQKIDFTSGMAAAGLTQSVSLGNKYTWRNGIAFSAMEQEREEAWMGPRLPIYTNSEDYHKAKQLSFFSRIQRSFSSRFKTELGLQFIGRSAKVMTYPVYGVELLFREKIKYTLTQPYLKTVFVISPAFDLEGGLRMSYFNYRNESGKFDSKNATQLEPYGKLSWHPTNNSSWQISYSRQSQVLPDQSLVLTESNPGTAAHKGLIDSQYTGLGGGYRIKEHLTLTTELFYQHLNKLPATENDLAWNYLSEPFLMTSGLGSATTFGIDIQLQRDFFQGRYFLLSASVFDAHYKGKNGQKIQSPFNSQWSASLTSGREWTKEKGDGERSWGIHSRLHVRGGYRYTAINAALSQQFGAEVENWDMPYAEQYPFYHSLDLRVSNTRQKQGYTRIWSLDIQNLMNNPNIGWYYYDFFLQDVNSQSQLGIIPVLAYRIQF